jgi:hypothetical protein
LGLLEVTRRGQSGNGEFRRPSLFRIPYLPAYGKGPTHEWREIETVADAEKIARKARGAFEKCSRKKHFPSAGKPTGTGGENPPATSAGKPTEAPISPVRENPPLSRQVSSHLERAGPGQRDRPTPARAAAVSRGARGRGHRWRLVMFRFVRNEPMRGLTAGTDAYRAWWWPCVAQSEV